uniref:Uncharacterized protein n=1 Tax=Dicentrarchus labrax TaxID=13489 RepID=A0A8C4GPN4_DICLA
MPGSNTGHLPQTLVSLPGKLLCVPAASVTLGDSDDINHLILVEDSRNRHSLLQTLLCPVHLVRDASPIQLHLHDVGLFLFNGQQSHLEMEKVNKNPDFFIKSASALVTEMFCKDGFEGTQATDGLNVSHNPHHNDRRSVNNGNCLYLLSHTEASAVHLPQSVGHASLVSQEGGEVDRLAWVIFGPCAHLAPMLLATLVGQEPHVSMAGCMEFAMRLEKDTQSHYLFT